MEALHFGEGNDHPHRSLTPTVHTDTRELQNDHHQKWSTYLQQFHLNIKYKKGSTNNVANSLTRPPIMAITTVINSCGHKTFDWPVIYKSDPEFSHTYQMLLEGKQVPKFHLQDALLCHMGHLCVPSSERAKNQDDLGSALQSGC